ncbi:hypothetical protein [Actinacidiphila oryziradicis]|uniref:Uncharacterized protein n=1 Tax=Actinacidiphila oryziradicis TaxID=2571141 RepID=A0A4U0T7R4_9ACTN|nr:hypothetical protein [Actinacidiphila oryziradicis]TKA09525.1 hypothetical protein FCI23_22030 [Actinacidiphila oryziradicis]
MLVSISLALLFGGILAVLLKTGSLKGGSAFIATMFGFYLASTGLNGPITELTISTVHTLNGLL